MQGDRHYKGLQTDTRRENRVENKQREPDVNKASQKFSVDTVNWLDTTILPC